MTEADKVAYVKSVIKCTPEEEARLYRGIKDHQKKNILLMQSKRRRVQNYIPANGPAWIDGQKVDMNTTPGKPGFVQFRMRYPTGSWWKGIYVQDFYERELGAMKINDDGPVYGESFFIDRFDSRVSLEFWKAKFLGIHTWVYYGFVDTSEVDGKLVDIYYR